MATKKRFYRFPKLLTQQGKEGERKDRLYIIWPAEISGTGKRRKEYFGPADDPESRARYAAARAAWDRAREDRPAKEPKTYQRGRSDGASIAELVDRYIEHAKQRYRKHGEPTGTDRNVWYALRPFLIEYGKQGTEAFGLDELEAYQRKLDESGRLCRNQVNARIRIIKAMFVWGAGHRGKNGQRLVPPSTAGELKLIGNLRRGYCRAKDHPRRGSVPEATIEKTIKELPPVIAAMARVQLITGARPNEVRLMKAREITKTGKGPWEYRPESYKTEHFDGEGGRKIIFIGPRAQKVLRPFLDAAEKDTDGEGYLFRPEDSAAKRRAESAEKKKTPSRRARDESRAENPRRKYNRFYTASSYRNAVARAAERAGVQPFTPYQIRKARATEIDRKLGAEAAAIQLGHRNVRTTLDYYIDPRTEQARELARKIG